MLLISNVTKLFKITIKLYYNLQYIIESIFIYNTHFS